MFEEASILAILAGHKTQTRRKAVQKGGKPSEFAAVLPGDTLWTREPLQVTAFGLRYVADHRSALDITTLSDDEPDDVAKMEWWKKKGGEDPASAAIIPAMFQPRWASRLQLPLAVIRTEFVQDISERDAVAEGLSSLSKDGTLYKWGLPDRSGLPGNDDFGWRWFEWERDPRTAYRRWFENLNGPDAWTVNHPVVVLDWATDSHPAPQS